MKNESILNVIEEAKILLEKAKLLNEELNRLLEGETECAHPMTSKTGKCYTCHDYVKPEADRLKSVD